MKRTAIIMAGGSGERFWPLSRKTKPKQLLKITSDLTMLEEAIERIAPLIPMEDVYIITSEILLEPIRSTLSDFPAANVIAEPYKRNTAPCLALGAAFILEKYRNEFKSDEISIAILTADQMISPVSGFVKTVESAMNFIEKERKLSNFTKNLHWKKQKNMLNLAITYGIAGCSSGGWIPLLII